MTNIKLIGIGHKARQGKDTLATFLKKELDKQNIPSIILHWADALKYEVINSDRRFPLIQTIEGPDRDLIYYMLLNKKGDRYGYEIYNHIEFPELHILMQDGRMKHGQYMGMSEKDSPLLQVWGTNYRREKCDPLYWIKASFNEIKDLVKNLNNKQVVVLIPDTRFKNELRALKEKGGKYINIRRLKKDGEIFIDPSRDPTHLSEIDLDMQASDYEIMCDDGDLQEIREHAVILSEQIKNGTF